MRPDLARRAPGWVVCLTLTSAAHAHDTWFEPGPLTARGEQALVLGTGTQYPTFEFPITMTQVAVGGCRAEGMPTAPLLRVAERTDALALRSSQALTAPGPVCWAQLVPIELTGIGPDLVALYFDEINASAAVRAARAAQVARGVPWQESYVKHARIELDSARPATAPAAAVPLGMDALMTAPHRPVQVGDALEFQVLRDGRPLPDQPVEFRSNLSRFGFWRRTDTEGRVRFTPPLPARWMLRGTDLRLTAGDPDRWSSRFLTLIFDVVQRPSNVSSNARSTNQTAASSAITAEPPASTPRR